MMKSMLSPKLFTVSLVGPFCRRVTFVLLTALVALPLTGCGPATPSVDLGLREKLLLEQSPTEIASLAESYAAFQPEASLVAAGRIFADKVSPFAPDTASFSLIELPKPGHDHENPGDCPFCKREMENAATAIVEMVDESGQVISGSAEQLLGLRKNQDVVVVGTATMVGEVMVIRARSLHLLSEEQAGELAKRFSS